MILLPAIVATTINDLYLCSVKVCGVTLGVEDRRRLTCLSGLLNDKVSG